MATFKSEARDDLFLVSVDGRIAGFFREVEIGGEPYLQLFRWDGTASEELGAISGTPEAAALMIEDDYRSREVTPR